MDEVRFEPGEFREVGGRVIAQSTLIARGRATGIEVQQEVVLVWSLRDDQVIRVEVFATLEEALEAAEAAGPPSRAGSPRRAPIWARLTAPSRRTRQDPSESSAVRSTTVEGSPPSSPPSIARSAPSRIRDRFVEAARRRLAAAVGARLEDRAGGAGQRALDQPDPSRSGCSRPASG